MRKNEQRETSRFISVDLRGAVFSLGNEACILFNRLESLDPSKQFAAKKPAATLGYDLVSWRGNKSVPSKDAFSSVTWRINISGGGGGGTATRNPDSVDRENVNDSTRRQLRRGVAEFSCEDNSWEIWRREIWNSWRSVLQFGRYNRKCNKALVTEFQRRKVRYATQRA